MENLHIVLRAEGGIDKYPAKSHAKRVARKLGLPGGLVVLEGTKSAFYSNSDQPVPFRQDRYFYYLTGCNEPNCLVTYDLAKDWLTLWLPAIDFKRFFFDGRGSTIDEALQQYDIDEAKYLHKNHTLFNLSPLEVYVRKDRAHDGKFILLDLWSGNTTLDQTFYDANILKPAMEACRAVKDKHEIALIRRANEITAEAHRKVLLGLSECKSEAEAEAIYTQTCIASRAREQAYGPIFGSGPNASTLHYVKNDERFGDRPLLLIDAGCEWQCYASDVTRTVPLNAKTPGYWPSSETELVYNAVSKIQKECIKLMVPGRKFSEVAWAAQHLATDALLDLGILKGDYTELLRAGTSRAFFPHGLGHHLGLEVHDVQPPATKKDANRITRSGQAHDRYGSGSNKSHMNFADVLDYSDLHTSFAAAPAANTAEDPPMEPGNVITVEPGIYFNTFFLEAFILPDPVHSKFIVKDVLKRFMPVGGVRIEDDILITKSGHENLTTAPKGQEMLDILRQR